MKPLFALTAAAVAAATLTATAGAGLPASARTLMAHRESISPKREYVLANQTIRHARDVLGFLRSNPTAGTETSRRRVRAAHEWLLRFGVSELSRAQARLRVGPFPVDSCTATILSREGGMNPHAKNPKSGAYGGPQALPGSKMASAGADWADNIWTQIRWMIGYETRNYGSPCGALAFWNAHLWY